MQKRRPASWGCGGNLKPQREGRHELFGMSKFLSKMSLLSIADADSGWTVKDRRRISITGRQ